MENKTDNELIAEFMGILKVSSKKYLSSPTYCHPVWGETDKTGLHYNTSLDWLMPVVIKLFQVLSDIKGQREVFEYSNLTRGTIERSIWDYLYSRTDLKTVCENVAEGIKWYNNHGKQ